jgi:hypothetical protein
MEANDRVTLVQLVGQMLISDGVLGDDERMHLDRLMDGLEMPPEERKRAFSGIDVDSPVEERVASLTEPTKARLVEELEKAMHAGGEVAPGEERLLARVRALLSG